MTGDSGEISVAELRRELNRVLGTLEILTIRLETHYVTKEVFDLSKKLDHQKLDELTGDITSIKSNITWFLRLVGGVLVIALLSLIIINDGGNK